MEQEVLRKDLERAFGVLISPWELLKNHSELWEREEMVKVMKTDIILQNMIVEARKRDLPSSGSCGRQRNVFGGQRRGEAL